MSRVIILSTLTMCSIVAYLHSARLSELIHYRIQRPYPVGTPATATSKSSCNGQTSSLDDEQSKPEVFSELPLFLFGSGLALFVALLGWSDQIRGVDKDTRELERRFLEKTAIDKQDFLSIVKPESPDDRLDALTQILASGKAQKVTVECLNIFKAWHDEWTNLEKLLTLKYRLAVALTYSMFVAGLVSLLVDPQAGFAAWSYCVRAGLLILVLPVLGILAILTIIVMTNRKEAYFHELLTALSEKV